MYLSREDLQRKKDSMVWYPNDFVVSQEGLQKASCKLMCDFITKLHKTILLHTLVFVVYITQHYLSKQKCSNLNAFLIFVYMSLLNLDLLYIKV